ncbi:hypothetical protein PIB30_026288 [Stylosanthes scabra]|uniref:Uncharacterized protein n=1 Tax=Stylosanthes scabra TaxID=79078 RepID=A0ABU6U9V6_9FABA|nr:hypothetical protein [Stylosanthes scabra]
MLVKVIIFSLLLMMMGFSVNTTEAGGCRHQQLDPKLITTSYYSPSQDALHCKCLDISVSCLPSCERCGCLEPNNGHDVNNLCMCDDFHKSVCPYSCFNCYCTKDKDM